MPARKNLHMDASPALFDYAKQNRKEITDAENWLWQHLKNRTLRGHKFRRQHVIGNFILDFYCHMAKLAIEVDGSIHHLEEVKERDERKNEYLESIGVELLRFTNDEVIHETKYVLARIIKKLPEKDTWVTEK